MMKGDVEYYKSGFDSEIYFYSRALARDITKRFRLYLEKTYGENYRKYNELFDRVSRELIKKYDVSKYRKNSNLNVIGNVYIYGLKANYAPKRTKSIPYTPDLFDVGGEAFSNGRINIFINKLGFDNINSVDDLNEMYDK